ncbi:MAG: sodium ion-translocating decarboxylase subunit beta [Phycisphaerales bacterium]
MHFHDLLNVFQGLQTFLDSDPIIIAARLGLIVLGIVLVFLACKGTLEPLLMIPMGFGMIAANAGVLILDPVTTSHLAQTAASANAPAAQQGTLFVAPLVEHTDDLMYMLQVDFLQPVYTLTFSNGLIACLVFMGIGALLDTSYLLARPIESMFLALCAELGTIVTFPIALLCKLPVGESAAISMVGGADGPMVMFTSLVLARDAFVPITVVAYLYLGLTYGGYPYLIKLMVPKKLRGTPTTQRKHPEIPARHKIIFALVACAGLCLLFPIAAPLFLSLFLGVAVREANIVPFVNLLTGPILYGSTFFLGLMLGVLCEAHIILDPTVLLLLGLGIFALLLSGIGGILGGYVLYFWHNRQYNPVIGIAGVSCVPTTAKVAQKIVQAENPGQIILAEALGANISGVITSAIICGLYLTVIPLLTKPH